VGRPPSGALLVLWGGSRSFYEGYIYFERNVGARLNIYFEGREVHEA
jgi:hypothetical protein